MGWTTTPAPTPTCAGPPSPARDIGRRNGDCTAPMMSHSPVPRLGLPNLGYGVGLRSCHFRYIRENIPTVDWFEVISENYMDSEGLPHTCSIADRRALSGRDARRVAVDRQHRSPRLRIPARARGTSRDGDTTCTGCPITCAGPAWRAKRPRLAAFSFHRAVAFPCRAPCGVVQDFLERPLVFENPEHVRLRSPHRRRRNPNFSACHRRNGIAACCWTSITSTSPPSIMVSILSICPLAAPVSESSKSIWPATRTAATTSSTPTTNHVVNPVWHLYLPAHRADRPGVDAARMGRSSAVISRTPRRGGQSKVAGRLKFRAIRCEGAGAPVQVPTAARSSTVQPAPTRGRGRCRNLTSPTWRNSSAGSARP